MQTTLLQCRHPRCQELWEFILKTTFKYLLQINIQQTNTGKGSGAVQSQSMAVYKTQWGTSQTLPQDRKWYHAVTTNCDS